MIKAQILFELLIVLAVAAVFSVMLLGISLSYARTSGSSVLSNLIATGSAALNASLPNTTNFKIVV